MAGGSSYNAEGSPVGVPAGPRGNLTNTGSRGPSLTEVLNRVGLDNKTFFEDSTNVAAKLQEVRVQLDSSNEKDKMMGMKRLIAVR